MNPQRKIFGAMAVVAAFTVGGEAIKGKVSPLKVFLGAGVATVILVGVADFGGEIGGEFAQGVAVLALLAAVLVEGGPVWQKIETYTGAKPTTPTQTATTPTGTTGATDNPTGITVQT